MATGTPCIVLSAQQIVSRIDELCDVLEQCVNDGASVSFIHPFNRDKSLPFWTGVAQSVARGERIVLALKTRRVSWWEPSSLLSINLKTNRIVPTSPNYWCIRLHDERVSPGN